MTKRLFFGIFKPAFEKAFSEENIWSAWSKTGLWPYNPDIVLNAIRARPNTDKINEKDKSDREVKTPYTTKSIRRFYKHSARNPTKDLQRKLFKANILLAVEQEINAHWAEYLKRGPSPWKGKEKEA